MVQVRARDDEGAMAYGRAVLSGAAASDQDQELLQARRAAGRSALHARPCLPAGARGGTTGAG